MTYKTGDQLVGLNTYKDSDYWRSVTFNYYYDNGDINATSNSNVGLIGRFSPNELGSVIDQYSPQQLADRLRELLTEADEIEEKLGALGYACINEDLDRYINELNADPDYDGAFSYMPMSVEREVTTTEKL